MLTFFGASSSSLRKDLHDLGEGISFSETQFPYLETGRLEFLVLKVIRDADFLQKPRDTTIFTAGKNEQGPEGHPLMTPIRGLQVTSRSRHDGLLGP